MEQEKQDSIRISEMFKRQNQYVKDNYDRVALTLPKGTKERIKNHSSNVNGFIREAVIEKLESLENNDKLEEYKKLLNSPIYVKDDSVFDSNFQELTPSENTKKHELLEQLEQLKK